MNDLQFLTAFRTQNEIKRVLRYCKKTANFNWQSRPLSEYHILNGQTLVFDSPISEEKKSLFSFD